MHARLGITVNRFIYNEQREFPQASGEFSEILAQIALASKIVSREVNRAGLSGILGAV
ncbi:MAG: fructose-bisphosphatase class I, partial [Gemmatimonadetes bacterium]|nr:fructose-bisphosphatase class I [Gemmatimonadota bacterium]